MSALLGVFARRGKGSREASPDLAVVVTPAALPSLTEPSSGPDRRQRPIPSAEDSVRDVVASKILHGWLQNRHQVLLPLTVNFRRLGESDALLLVETMAMACLAGASGPVHGREAARRFIEQCGGSDALVAAFELAFERPAPFHTVLDRVRAARDLAAFSYIVATVVTDSRDSTDQLFLQWMAARLDLPNTVKRSVERRYRS